MSCGNHADDCDTLTPHDSVDSISSKVRVLLEDTFTGHSCMKVVAITPSRNRALTTYLYLECTWYPAISVGFL